MPPILIETSLFPASHLSFLIGIIALTLEETAIADRTVIEALPALRIAHDGLLAAIIVGDDKLHQQRLMVAKEVEVAARESHRASVPSRTQLCTDGILSALQHRGHVISMITHHLAELAVTRREPIFTHALPIDPELIVAHSRRIELSLLDGLAFRGGKLRTQHGQCSV